MQILKALACLLLVAGFGVLSIALIIAPSLLLVFLAASTVAGVFALSGGL